MNDSLPPLLRAGFRPFFLGAGAYAAVAVAPWAALMAGYSIAWSPDVVWHGHEMIYGFAAAALAGFLLTAVPNWVGGASLRGTPLAALSLLWLAGRAAWIALPQGYPLTLAAIDLAFLPALALAVGPSLVAARNPRNLIFLPVLLTFWTGNLLIHLDALGVSGASASEGLRLGLSVLVLLIVLVGGRIVPSFTASGLQHTADAKPAITVWPRLGMLALALGVVWVFAWTFAPENFGTGFLSLALALLLTVRMSGWHSLDTMGTPILWVLHLGYAWTIIGFAMTAAASLTSVIPVSMAMHAHAIGAVGTMMIAVMSRASLGHTGRRIHVSGPVVAAYVMISGAALARMAATVMAEPGPAYGLAGLLWSLAFILYTLTFWPILTSAREDGQPG